MIAGTGLAGLVPVFYLGGEHEGETEAVPVLWVPEAEGGVAAAGRDEQVHEQVHGAVRLPGWRMRGVKRVVQLSGGSGVHVESAEKEVAG